MPRLTRRPNSRPAATPRRRKASALPLLPLLAASLVVLATAQSVIWWMQLRPQVPTGGLTGNPFTDISHWHPLSAPAPEPAKPDQHLSAPALPQNLQFGDPHGAVVLTVFSDPACGECRERVRAVLATLPPAGVRIVQKFWPRDPSRLTPGMLVLLARQQGVAAAFWHQLEQAKGDLDDTTLLNLLDTSGVRLADQRSALVADGARLTSQLDSDIHTATQAKLAPPPVFVVGDVVAADGDVAGYVAQQLKGEGAGK